MSESWRPVDGDEITTTTPAAATPAEDDVHTAETSAAPVDETPEDDEVVRTSPARRQIDWRPILIVAIAVLVALQVVVGFLALGSINQVRDQLTSSNGLQRCIYNAEINATDQASQTSAFKACLK